MRQHHGPLLLSPFSGVASIFLKNIPIIFLSPGLPSAAGAAQPLPSLLPCEARIRRRAAGSRWQVHHWISTAWKLLPVEEQRR